MQIEISSKRLFYRLDIKGKYSVIQGDSGNGKTNLCRLLRDRQTGDRTITVKSGLPVITIDSFSTGDELEKISDSVIVIDEYYKVLQQADIGNLLSRSDNYFIIISRKNLDFLPLCVENLYDMKCDGRNHWIEPRYKVSNKKEFNRINHIVTEDSASGYEFFKNHFNINTSSAHSKSEIVRYLSAQVQINSLYNDILVVYDSAAFAYQKAYLDTWVIKSKLRVQVLDWYSFENYILTQKPFNINLSQDDIGKRWESLEQASEAILDKCIGYSKGHLPECLKSFSSCNSCNRVDTCNYKHNSFTPDIKINGF